jgi:hypothetical protein
MRIENAMAPTIQAIKPRDEMEVEVVSAGVAVDQLRRHSDRSRQQNNRRSGE